MLKVPYLIRSHFGLSFMPPPASGLWCMQVDILHCLTEADLCRLSSVSFIHWADIAEWRESEILGRYFEEQIQNLEQRLEEDSSDSSSDSTLSWPLVQTPAVRGVNWYWCFGYVYVSEEVFIGIASFDQENERTTKRLCIYLQLKDLCRLELCELGLWSVISEWRIGRSEYLLYHHRIQGCTPLLQGFPC